MIITYIDYHKSKDYCKISLAGWNEPSNIPVFDKIWANNGGFNFTFCSSFNSADDSAKPQAANLLAQ